MVSATEEVDEDDEDELFPFFLEMLMVDQEDGEVRFPDGLPSSLSWESARCQS